MGKQWTLFWGGSKITADGECSHETKWHLLLGRNAMTSSVSILKSRDITLLTKVHLVRAMVFPVVMYGCESWTIKKAEHQRIDVFELWGWRRLLRVPWTARRSNQRKSNPKGNQSWIFTGRTDAEAETPMLWPPDVKNWLIGKDPNAGKDWRWEEKGTTEDEMVGWHHQLNGHESEQALGIGDGQGSLACCSPWGRKEWDTTEWLNWTVTKSIINILSDVPTLCLLPSFPISPSLLYHSMPSTCTHTHSVVEPPENSCKLWYFIPLFQHELEIQDIPLHN